METSATSPLVPPEIASGLESGRKASNLAFALLCLPKRRRSDMLEFYRFCRTVDDIADAPGIAPEERRRLLQAWVKALGDSALPGVPPSFASVVRTRGVDRGLLAEIVAGMLEDLDVPRYETFDSLRAYCWRAASAVGLAALPLLGASHASRPYAEALGIALQLANILRDVGEDADRGRVYLPLEDLHRFGVDPDALASGREPPGFEALMRFECERAREWFARAAAALPPQDRRSLRAPEIMSAIYRRLLDRMESGGFRVISRRVRIAKPEKAWLAAAVVLGFGGGATLPAAQPDLDRYQ